MTNWKRTLFSSGGGGETTWGVQLRNTASAGDYDRMGLTVGDDGSVYVAEGFVSGYGESTYATNVIKVDTDGAFQWSRRLSVSGNNTPYCRYPIMLDGSPVLLGVTQDYLIGSSQEGIAIKLNPTTGANTWAEHYGKSGTTYNPSIGHGSPGGVQSGNIGLFTFNGSQPKTQRVMVRFNSSGVIQSSNMATFSLSAGKEQGLLYSGVGPSDAIFLSGYIEQNSPSYVGNFTVLNSTGSSVTWNASVKFSSSSYYAEGMGGCMDSAGNGYHTGRIGGSGQVGTYFVKFPSGGGSLSWSNCYYETSGQQPLIRTRIVTDDTSVFGGGYGGDPSTSASGAWLSYATSNGSLNYHKLVRMNNNYTWIRDIALSNTGFLYLLGTDYSVSPTGMFVMKVSVDGLDNGSYGDFDITDASRSNGTTPIYNSGYTPSISNEGMTDLTDTPTNNASTGTWTETLQSFA